jgi:hypothetical protein
MKRFLARICVKLTGFKPSRIREWRTAVASEAKTLGWGVLLTELAKGALGLGGVSRWRWRARARACRACPVFDRGRRMCRNGELGCGCYMPAKSLVAGGACWIRGIGEQSYGFE